MPDFVADRFGAIGAGNGFLDCLDTLDTSEITTQYPTGEFRDFLTAPPSISINTLEESMRYWWNLAFLEYDFAIRLTENSPTNPDPIDYSITSENDFSEYLIEPKLRVCNSAFNTPGSQLTFNANVNQTLGLDPYLVDGGTVLIFHLEHRVNGVPAGKPISLINEMYITSQYFAEAESIQLGSSVTLDPGQKAFVRLDGPFNGLYTYFFLRGSFNTFYPVTTEFLTASGSVGFWSYS